MPKKICEAPTPCRLCPESKKITSRNVNQINVAFQYLKGEMSAPCKIRIIEAIGQAYLVPRQGKSKKVRQ